MGIGKPAELVVDGLMSPVPHVKVGPGLVVICLEVGCGLNRDMVTFTASFSVLRIVIK